MNFLCAAGKDEGQDGQASNPKGMHGEFGTADTAGSLDCCAADFVPAGCELCWDSEGQPLTYGSFGSSSKSVKREMRTSERVTGGIYETGGETYQD